MYPEDKSPIDSPSAVWCLQNFLLEEVEHRIGPRLQDKKIYQPDWDEGGPHLRHTKEKDGAYAELAPNAQSNWFFCTYQLAHETVHLLTQNTDTGANIFEEGLAVRFSLDMLSKLGFDISDLPATENYKYALNNFDKLGDKKYVIAAEIRSQCGNYVDCDSEILKKAAPNLSDEDISALLNVKEMRP